MQVVTCRMRTLRQKGLLCMALQELFWTGAVHAIGMAKGGCWLNPLNTHFILSWVNFALVLHKIAKCKWERVKPQNSL